MNQFTSDCEDRSLEKETVSIPAPTYSEDEEWVQVYKEQFGEEPSFF